MLLSSVETILLSSALLIHYLYSYPYLLNQTHVSTSLTSFNKLTSEDRGHYALERRWTTSQPPESILAPSSSSPGLPLTSELNLEARKLQHLPSMEPLTGIPCDLLSHTSIHPYHPSPSRNSLQTTSLHHNYPLPSSIIHTMLRNRAPYSSAVELIGL